MLCSAHNIPHRRKHQLPTRASKLTSPQRRRTCIRTFKNHFIASLSSSVDKNFPSTCGTSSSLRQKQASVCSMDPESTQSYLPMRNVSATLTAIAPRWPRPAFESEFTSSPRTARHGCPLAKMAGMLALPSNLIGVTPSGYGCLERRASATYYVTPYHHQNAQLVAQ